MKNRKTLKQLILGSLLLLSTNSLFAQTQKVQTLQAKSTTTSTTMNSDALIQMDSNNKGLLLPRIALTGANQVAPLTAHTAGMVVYNTATVAATATIEAVTPGYYYNNGTKWVKIANTDTADITNDAWVNNITTNVVELATKADGTTARTATEQVVITDDGKMGVGTTSPQVQLEVAGKSSNTDGPLMILKNNAKAHTDASLMNYIGFRDKDNTEFAYVGEGSSGRKVDLVAHYGYDLELATFSSNTVASHKGLLFMSGTTGNVGIGTETPTTKLEVKDGEVTINSLQAQLNLNGVGGTGLSSSIRTSASSSGKGWLIGQGGGSSTLSSPDDMTFYTHKLNPPGGGALFDYVNRMVIQWNTGNVGIGEINPTEKLHVTGKIKAYNVIFTGIPTYADDAAAGAGGLVAGEMYKTATGELRIKL